MDEDLIKKIDEESVKISNDLYVIIWYGRMIILEKRNVYGDGYREVVTFSHDDFEKLKKLADEEEKKVKDGLKIINKIRGD